MLSIFPGVTDVTFTSASAAGSRPTAAPLISSPFNINKTHPGMNHDFSFFSLQYLKQSYSAVHTWHKNRVTKTSKSVAEENTVSDAKCKAGLAIILSLLEACDIAGSWVR